MGGNTNEQIKFFNHYVLWYNLLKHLFDKKGGLVMPEYELIDMKGSFSWIKVSNGTYLVDKTHEKEFINFWTEYFLNFPEKHQ
jgi:hypothetical protein